MNRLPGSELATPRLEASVFGCLAVAGVAAVLYATASCAGFVAGRDAVIAVLQGRPAFDAPATSNVGVAGPTNAARIETGIRLARGRTKV